MSLLPIVKDREPQDPGARNIIRENGAIERVHIVRDDNPLVIGTPINRALWEQQNPIGKIFTRGYYRDDPNSYLCDGRILDNRDYPLLYEILDPIFSPIEVKARLLSANAVEYFDVNPSGIIAGFTKDRIIKYSNDGGYTFITPVFKRKNGAIISFPANTTAEWVHWNDKLNAFFVFINTYPGGVFKSNADATEWIWVYESTGAGTSTYTGARIQSPIWVEQLGVYYMLEERYFIQVNVSESYDGVNWTSGSAWSGGMRAGYLWYSNDLYYLAPQSGNPLVINVATQQIMGTSTANWNPSHLFRNSPDNLYYSGNKIQISTNLLEWTTISTNENIDYYLAGIRLETGEYVLSAKKLDNSSVLILTDDIFDINTYKEITKIHDEQYSQISWIANNKNYIYFATNTGILYRYEPTSFALPTYNNETPFTYIRVR